MLRFFFFFFFGPISEQQTRITPNDFISEAKASSLLRYLWGYAFARHSDTLGPGLLTFQVVPALPTGFLTEQELRTKHFTLCREVT